jgi:hypothetical protein
LGDALSTQLASLEQLTLLRLSEAAREQDRGQTAMGAVTLAEPLSEVFAGTADLEKRARALVTEEFASVLWAQGEHAIAIQALEEHIQLDAPNGIEAEVQRAMVLAKLVSRLASMVRDALTSHLAGTMARDCAVRPAIGDSRSLLHARVAVH